MLKEIKEPVLTGKQAHIARLRAGETVAFREGGNSMCRNRGCRFL